MKSAFAATVAVAAILISGGSSFAEGCDDYPNTVGMNVETVSDGVKIVSTAEAVVNFDDQGVISDARDEAVLVAKAALTDFFSELVRSDVAVNRAVLDTKSMQGDAKAVARKEAVERIKKLSSSSQALLRGVVLLGECYTKGRLLRVSVGVKPDTILAAEGAAGSMSQSIARQPGGATSGTASPPAPTQRLDGSSSYSRSDALRKF